MVNDRKKAVLVRIAGKVQGVSFRVWTRNQALRLGLTGWVRNEDDGSVMSLIVGSEPVISTMLQQFWNGPPGASVSSVETEPAPPVDAPSEFRILS